MRQTAEKRLGRDLAREQFRACQRRIPKSDRRVVGVTQQFAGIDIPAVQAAATVAGEGHQRLGFDVEAAPRHLGIKTGHLVKLRTHGAVGVIHLPPTEVRITVPEVARQPGALANSEQALEQVIIDRAVEVERPTRGRISGPRMPPRLHPGDRAVGAVLELLGQRQAARRILFRLLAVHDHAVRVDMRRHPGEHFDSLRRRAIAKALERSLPAMDLGNLEIKHAAHVAVLHFFKNGALPLRARHPGVQCFLERLPLLPADIHEDLVHPELGRRLKNMVIGPVEVESTPHIFVQGQARRVFHRNAELALAHLAVAVLQRRPEIERGGVVEHIRTVQDRLGVGGHPTGLLEPMEFIETDRILAGVGLDSRADKADRIKPADEDAGLAVLEIEAGQKAPARPHIAGKQGGPLVEPHCGVGRLAPDFHPGRREPVAADQVDIVEAATEFPSGAIQQTVDRTVFPSVFEPVGEAVELVPSDRGACGLESNGQLHGHRRLIKRAVAEAEVARGVAPLAEGIVHIAHRAQSDARLLTALLDSQKLEAVKDLALVAVEPRQKPRQRIAQRGAADRHRAD